MGDSFSTASPPVFDVKLNGTAPFAKVHVVKDNQYVYSIDPKTAKVEFTMDIGVELGEAEDKVAEVLAPIALLADSARF